MTQEYVGGVLLIHPLREASGAEKNRDEMLCPSQGSGVRVIGSPGHPEVGVHREPPFSSKILGGISQKAAQSRVQHHLRILSIASRDDVHDA
ncbi:hypothetical protein GCM10009563_33220 [Subtercola frigoramans]